jgi:hypothetical protein
MKWNGIGVRERLDLKTDRFAERSQSVLERQPIWVAAITPQCRKIELLDRIEEPPTV